MSPQTRIQALTEQEAADWRNTQSGDDTGHLRDSLIFDKDELDKLFRLNDIDFVEPSSFPTLQESAGENYAAYLTRLEHQLEGDIERHRENGLVTAHQEELLGKLQEQRHRATTVRMEHLRDAQENLEGSAPRVGPKPGSTPSQQELVFEGMDCSKPANRRTVLPAHERECSERDHDLSSRNATYRVLQKASYFRMKATLCKQTVTTLTAYCGTYDHQTIVTSGTSFHQPMKWSGRSCKEATARPGEWKMVFRHPLVEDKRENRNTIELTPGVIDRSAFEVVGSTRFHSMDVKCKGGRAKLPDHYGNEAWRNGLVMTAYVETLAEEVTLMVTDDDVVYVKESGVKLPCAFGDHMCEDVDQVGTVYWGPVSAQERCPLYTARAEVHGVNVGSSEGKMFISQSSMIRLNHRDSITYCGSNVIATEYDKLFLVPQHNSNQWFVRQIDTEEASAFTYANIGDQFIYGAWTDYVKNVFHLQMEHECKKKKATSTFALAAARQGTFTGRETAALGNAFFGVATGELVTMFQCVPIATQWRPTGKCHASLPVTLSAADKRRYLSSRMIHAKDSSQEELDKFQNKNKHLSEMEFFLEAKSRRIVTVTTEVPCNPVFPDTWKNLKGHWIEFHPKPQFASPPLLLNDDTERSRWELPPPNDYSFQDGGLYTAEMVNDVDRLTQISTFKEMFFADLSTKFYSRGSRVNVDPGSVFPQLPDLNYWKWIMDTIKKWSGTLSAIMLAFYVLKFCTFLFGICYRLRTIRGHGGNIVEQIGSLFPSVFSRSFAAILHHERHDNRQDGPEVPPPRTYRNSLVRPRRQAPQPPYPRLRFRDLEQRDAGCDGEDVRLLGNRLGAVASRATAASATSVDLWRLAGEIDAAKALVSDRLAGRRCRSRSSEVLNRPGALEAAATTVAADVAPQPGKRQAPRRPDRHGQGRERLRSLDDASTGALDQLLHDDGQNEGRYDAEPTRNADQQVEMYPELPPSSDNRGLIQERDRPY